MSEAEIQLDPEIRFTRLAQRFMRDTAHMSFTQTQHPAYREVVSMGITALPYILRDLSRFGGAEWIPAIREITGKPGPEIAENERGRVPILKRKYLAWALAEGYEVAEGESPVGELRRKP